MADRRGFTLIEISVVTGIIGLILLFSFPTLTVFRDQIHLESSAKQLISDLRLMQVRAICLGEEQSFQAGSRKFTFAKTGSTPPGGSGTEVIVGQSGHRRRVIVSSAGRVRLE